MIFFRSKANEPRRQDFWRVEEALRGYALMSKDQLFQAMASGSQGLTAQQAAERLEEQGPNKITAGREITLWTRIREVLINPFNIVLMIIAIITLLTDVVFSSKPDYLTLLILVGLVMVSSAVAFIQNQRSSAAAEKLSQMIQNIADVWRDGQVVEVPLDEVVPGDVVRLSAGDMMPADLRFLTAKDAFVAQAALTGESVPVEKLAEQDVGPKEALLDMATLGLMGANMVSGSATALVLATGNHTYLGAMAKTLDGNRAQSSFERGVSSVSRLLMTLMIMIVPVVFLINGLIKGDWVQSLLFAVSVAVGLTPEMLPVIMTSTLAKGAVNLSKQKVIVKSLGAIQTFGEMDVLCTDKTGTLTEDHIILEKYLNAQGQADDRILRHAYLNSHFQTGLKNLLDVAIITRAQRQGLEPQLARFTRMDEIPFDFQRRRMSVVLQDHQGKRQLITKGAPEEIFAVCSFIEADGQVLPLDDTIRARAMQVWEGENADGLRMLAIAQKNDVPDTDHFGVADEKDMVLIGFVGFLDPPKQSAAAAIKTLGEHGVRIMVLTGDSEGVAIKVCREVGVPVQGALQGPAIDQMDDRALDQAVRETHLMSKLSPAQKKRVVEALQAQGHTVGYLGDGINDAPALQQADVGISVDSAVDIAKETADLILLEKDLMVLEHGVQEGRRTFGNIMKYLKMATSGNFGNMISVLLASVFLPFLPILPVQILIQNLLCDFSQMGIPFDRVDGRYLAMPRRWDTKGIRRFMGLMGPLSSLFDLLCFGVLWFILGANRVELAPLFHCGWFLFGTLSQIAVIHMIRTEKVPFLQSRASLPLMISTLAVMVAVIFIGFTPLAHVLEMTTLPGAFAPWLVGLLAFYCLAVQGIKGVFIRRYGAFL